MFTNLSGEEKMDSLQNETLEFMKSIGLSSSNNQKFLEKDNISQIKDKKEKKLKDKSNVSVRKAKQKVNARKWGKETKEKEKVEAPKSLGLVIKGDSREIGWLNVKLDPNQQVISTLNDVKWYDSILSFDRLDFKEYKISKQALEHINSIVGSLFNQEVAKYHKSKALNGDEKWMNDVIKSGTLSDKVAALALRVQQAPIHELESLDLLISMAAKKEQRTSQLALEALKDLLLHNLLPDRRLVPYALRPLGHPSMSITVLLTFWYENELIRRIESIVSALEVGLKSNVDFFKMKCMDIVASWLCAKPEQENVLLTLLVNKLGDPSAKVGSKCITLLGNIIFQHPAMKLVLIREVRQLISRSTLTPRAVYSGVLFLSQIKLSLNENKVAVELVDCYVSLFEKAITQDKLGSKLLAALLTGINRAYPYLVDKLSLSKHTDALFKIVYNSSFSSATQALTLLSYLALGHNLEKSQPCGNALALEDDKSDLSSRFYNSLYSKLLSDEILSRSHNSLFLNLLFRSMKRDPIENRALAFCKRILICSTHATPPIAAGLIFLVSEVCRSRPTLITKMVTSLESPSNDVVSSDESYLILGNYDGSKRNPTYACHDSSNGWELALFRSHFNPSVQSFAKSFLDPSTQHKIVYSGDPTIDFSLTSFLNRFAYKNPKKQQVDQRRKRSQVLSEEPVNTPAFLESSTEVAPEKVFFYKFFGERNRLIAEGRSRRKKKTQDDEDDEDDDRSDLGSDFDEAEIDRFADKLADDLMENYARNADIDDYDDEPEDFDNGEDFSEREDMAELPESDDYRSNSDSDDFEENSDPPKSQKIGSNKKRKNDPNDSVFAAAEDFEADMEANILGVVQYEEPVTDNQPSKQKRKKNKRSS